MKTLDKEPGSTICKLESNEYVIRLKHSVGDVVMGDKSPDLELIDPHERPGMSDLIVIRSMIQLLADKYINTEASAQKDAKAGG